MMNILKLALLLSLLSSCYLREDPTRINAESLAAKAKVFQLEVENDQLVINGSTLSGVKKVRIQGPGLDETFSIESNSGSKIIANGLRTIAFGVEKVFKLILSDAYGAATYQVQFTLDDSSVTAAKLAPSGALDGDVLIYDAATETWNPRPVGGSALVGTWDASSNNPALADDGWNTSPSRGDYYIVETSGSTLIDGNSTWNSGDWIIFDGMDWVRVANTGEVVTFNGRIGAVISQEGDYEIDQMSNVIAPSANLSVGDILKWNGSQFVASEDVTGNEAGAVESTAILDNSVASVDILDETITTSDIADDSVGSADITDNTITNIDISPAAGIDQSKIANLPTDLLNLNSGVTSNASAIAGLDTAEVAEDPSRLYFTGARARGAVSASAPINYDSSTGVISIPKADGLSNGYLSSADWTFFNNKQADLGYTPVDVAGDIMQGNLDFNGNILLNAGSLQIKDNDANYVELRTPANIALNYTLTFPADDGATNQVLTTDGSGVLSWTTPVDTARSSLSASAPLSYNGSTGQFSIGQASGSANGYLSSADWTTFNNKQNALGYTPVNKAGDTMTGNLSAPVITGSTSIRPATLLDTDGTNFFDGACADNQRVTSISSNGAITCGANSADISQVTAGAGLTGGGTAGALSLSHADTSSAANLANSGGIVAQSLTFDTYGHVTGTTSTNLDGRYYTEAESNSLYVNAAGDTMSGVLTLSGDPSANLHAATKQYVDNNGSKWTNVTGGINYGNFVGINRSPPDARLHISGYNPTIGDSSMRITNTTGNQTWQVSTGIPYIDMNSFAIAQINPDASVAATRFAITPNGYVGIGLHDTNGNYVPSERLHVKGTLRVEGLYSDCYIGNGTSGTNCSSDIRLKKNIHQLDGSLEKILGIRGVVFNWNREDEGELGHLGVIAQEVEDPFPEAVSNDPSTGFKLVDYASLVSPLIEAVKEFYNLFQESNSRQGEVNEEHKRKIAALEKRNRELEERLIRLEAKIDAEK